MCLEKDPFKRASVEDLLRHHRRVLIPVTTGLDPFTAFNETSTKLKDGLAQQPLVEPQRPYVINGNNGMYGGIFD